MNIIELLKSNNKAIISVAGGGGKSSLLYTFSKLYNNYHLNNTKILTTTTVKMAINYNTKDFDFFSYNMSDKEIFNITKNNNDKKNFLLFSSLDTSSNKLIGYNKKILDELFEKNIFDIIINEADGSRGLPIKAPNKNEPNHPKNTTDVFGVIGLSSYNKVIEKSKVHRTEIFNKITNTKINDIITKEVILKLVLSGDGLFKNTPKKSRKHLVLNQADTIKKDELENLFNYLSSSLKDINSITAISLKNSDEIILLKIF